MQKITPFLWFNDQAQEAIQFYISVFKKGRIITTTYYGEEGPGPNGSVLTIAFELNGQEFVALNGGPKFQFTEAISFVVSCETQGEIDYYWEKLSSDGGRTSQCGWLKDKYGLWWQVVPTKLVQFIQDEDKQRSQRVMHALMQMTKLDLAALEKAYEKE